MRKFIEKSTKCSGVRIQQGLAILTSVGVLAGCSTESIRSERATEAAQIRGGEAAAKAEKESRGDTAQNTRRAQANTEASAEYHFSLAQAYVADGNPDRAIEEYKLTLMFDPNSALVNARLATEYVKKGMLAAAMEACKEALRLDPNFTDARLMLAGLYSTAKDFDSALGEYDRILKKDPKNEEAVVYKAQIQTEEGNPDQGAKTLRQFVKANPESAVALYYLGRAEQSLNRFPEAIQAFRKALEIRPGFTQASLALGFAYEERSASHPKEKKVMTERAIETYRRLFESSQDVSAANRLATIYLKEEQYKKAIPYLEALEALDPEDLNVRVKLGLIRMELKEYDKAITVFKAILEKNPDSDRIHYYLGSLYEETKQNDAAIAELRKIKPGSKMYSDAALHVAYLMKQKGQVEQAKIYMKDSIARAPEISGFYVFAASLEEETRNLSEAISILESGVKKFTEDEKIRYYLGSLYDRQGDTDRGLEQMEEIIKINPENVDALNYIGYTWTQKGVRLNDAEKMLRRALGLKPDNGYIQDSWGWYLYVRGRVSEAVVELEKAARLKPNEPTILEHLGDAYLRSNLREKALYQYRNAAKYAEDESIRRKIEAKAENLSQELASGSTGPTGSAERMPASVPSSGIPADAK